MGNSSSTAAQSDARLGSAETIALNSERIRDRYGNCTVRVLEQRGTHRRTALFSTDATGDTCRTFAVVRFATEIPSPLASAHARITSGESIGRSLADHRLPINRLTLAIRTITLDKGAAALLELMRLDTPVDAAVHIYRLELEGREGSLTYATIAELHHPSYLDENVLTAEYTVAPVSATDAALCDEMLAIVQRPDIPIGR